MRVKKTMQTKMKYTYKIFSAKTDDLLYVLSESEYRVWEQWINSTASVRIRADFKIIECGEKVSA